MSALALQEAEAAWLVAEAGEESLAPCQRMHLWILRDPSRRSVVKMASVGAKRIVVLRSKAGDHTSDTQECFDSAIRTVLMIANFEGEK